MMLPILGCLNWFVKDFGLDITYPEYMTIGQRTLGAMMARKVSQADLARMCGVDRQYINNIVKDRGTKPDPNNLAAIAARLDVDLHWLITGDGTPERTTVSADELALIKLYRRMSPTQQVAAMTLFNSMG